METNLYYLFEDLYHKLLNLELHVNEWVQTRLSAADTLFRLTSVYLNPGNLINTLIPLIGIIDLGLLTQLLCMATAVNIISSFAKWLYPEYRPLWWMREQYANGNALKPNVALKSFELSCEPSGGLPCVHSACFSIVLLIISSRFARTRFIRLIAYNIISCCVIWLWLSRLYLATEFLHQCILGTYIAISTVRFVDKHFNYFCTCRLDWSVSIVLIAGCLSTLIYFLKLHLHIDPHWSVRQAFKWCPEPTYIRHEDSVIFVLTRDLGNLMGIALSLPISQPKSHSSFKRRFGGILVGGIINHTARVYTPKLKGRFIFLAYEFVRNVVHSIVLIKILPIL